MSDFNKAIDTLKQMLETDDGQQSLKSITGMLSGGEDMPAAPSTPAQAMQSQGTPRHSLLSALRPYLSTKRQGKFDAALRILQITQLTALTKNLPPK